MSNIYLFASCNTLCMFQWGPRSWPLWPYDLNRGRERVVSKFVLLLVLSFEKLLALECIFRQGCYLSYCRCKKFKSKWLSTKVRDLLSLWCYDYDVRKLIQIIEKWLILATADGESIEHGHGFCMTRLHSQSMLNSTFAFEQDLMYVGLF